MKSERHVIGRQILEVALHSRARQSFVEKNLGDVYERLVLPCIEKIFSDCCKEGAILRIDRIELNLGTIQLSDLENQLSERVAASLREALLPFLDGTSVSRTLGGLAGSTDSVRATPVHAVGQIQDDEEQNCELCRSFLLTGVLPWWAEGISAISPDRMVSALTARPSKRVRSMLLEILTLPTARARLIHQVGEETLFAVAALVSGTDKAMIAAWINALQEQGVGLSMFPVPVEYFHFCLWDTYLAHLSEEKGVGNNRMVGELFRRRFFETLVQAFPEAAAQAGGGVTKRVGINADCTESQVSYGFSSGDVADQSSATPRQDQSFGFAVQAGQKMPLEYSAPPAKRTCSAQHSQGTQALERIEPSLRIEDGQERPVEHPGEEARLASENLRLSVDNAGLVILWPFLARLCDACDLLSEGRFKDEAAAVCAMHLIQFLATGGKNTPEYLLPLNKVLCGWPINMPVPRVHELPEPHREEAQKLLGDVIVHWQALRSTSPDGLRSSFLRRNGILSNDAMGWLLMVERKSFDVLLDRLPWTISTIRLSWMRKPLIVQW
ncbi:MAG: contractile injection system tape measure protein [Pseudomonadota bacterium]